MNVLRIALRRSHFLVLIVSLFLVSCRDPIDLSFPSSDAKVVVDGFITNVEKPHVIKLSYSSGFTEDGVHLPDPVLAANVEIEDDQGAVLPLTHQGNGNYVTPVFRADPQRSYRLRVRLESEMYESSFQQLPEPAEAVNVRYEPAVRTVLSNSETLVVEEFGVRLVTDLPDVSTPVYYQWLQQDFYIHDAFRAPTFFQGVPFLNKYCYVRDFDRIEVDVFENVPNTTGEDLEYEIGFIPTSYKLYHDFSTHVIQLITNEESYEYWGRIRDQIENVGSQFDAAPATIPGNIKREDGIFALGFFGVYRESDTRVFFYNCELPFSHRKSVFECPPAPRLADARLDPCYDCLNAPGIWSQLQAPEWWRPFTVEYLGRDERLCLEGGGGE